MSNVKVINKKRWIHRVAHGQELAQSLDMHSRHTRARCGCHMQGQKLIRPRSLKGLETWYRRWRIYRLSCQTNGHLNHLPDNTITASRESALAEFWDAVHASPTLLALKAVRAVRQCAKELAASGVFKESDPKLDRTRY